MSPRGLHADGEKPDGYYRGVRQLPPYVGCGAGVATARYPRESPGRFRRHLAFLARPSRSRCIDSLHGQLRVQLTSRCANKTVMSGTRRTTMPPMPHSGAAQNKGYGRSDFAGQSWDCAAILPAPNSLYCGCERSFGPAPTSQRRAATRRHYPAGISRARCYRRPSTPGVRMQKISPAHRVPPECPECGWPGTVTVQQTIQGDRDVFVWRCIACNAKWPVRDRQENPRLRLSSEDPDT